MSLRVWASGFLVLTLLSIAGCGKSNAPSSIASPGAGGVLTLVDLSAYKPDVEACFEATEDQFREECKDLDDRAPYEEGAELPIRTGDILLAEAPTDWRAADPEPPAWNLSLLDPKSDNEPQTIGFVFHTRNNQGEYQTQGEGDSDSSGSVKVFTKDALVFLVDRRSNTLLGSTLLRGPVPKEVKAGKSKILGKKPDLQILQNCDIVKLEETASKLDGLVKALSANEEDALAPLAANSQVESALINRLWTRFHLLTGSKASLESNYEGLVTSDEGLLTVYSLSNSKADTSPELIFSFKEETLFKVELDLSRSEEKQLAVRLAKGEDVQYETAESLAEIASTILAKKETALAESLLKLAETKANSREDKTVVKNLARAILRKKQERHSGKVELLNDDALGFLATKDYTSALAKLKQAQELNPNDDESLFLLLRTYDGLKNFKKARIYAQKLDQEHANSKYARRIQEFKERLEDRENRLKLGGDPSARYQLTSKTNRRLASHGYLTPTAQKELDEELAEFIRQGYSRGNRFQRLSLQSGTKATIEKVAYFKPEPKRSLNRRRSRYSRSYRYQPELDAAYVTVTSGNNKGRKGWVKLELVDYQDIGIASEPFALPLIDPNDAFQK